MPCHRKSLHNHRLSVVTFESAASSSGCNRRAVEKSWASEAASLRLQLGERTGEHPPPRLPLPGRLGRKLIVHGVCLEQLHHQASELPIATQQHALVAQLIKASGKEPLYFQRSTGRSRN